MTLAKKNKLIKEEKKAQKQYEYIERAIDSAFDHVEKLRQEGQKRQRDNFKVSLC